MAATGAYVTYIATSNREDLSGDIHMIDPTDTPIFSRIGTNEATNTNHEWQTEVLEAATADNAHVEGADFVGEDSIPTVRPRNQTQIFKKEPVVSGTQQRGMDHAGIADMMDHQVYKRLQEIKRDIEMSYTANKGLAVGNANTARVLRGLPSWLTSNINAAGDGVDPADETAGRTYGTPRPFDETILQDVEKKCYDSGGRPSMEVLGSANKQIHAGFQGRASARQNVGAATIQANVDVYVGNFFQLEIIADRNMSDPASNAFLLQPDMLKTSNMRPVGNEPIGKQGDNTKSQVVGELTLEVCNEAAHGAAYDLGG